MYDIVRIIKHQESVVASEGLLLRCCSRCSKNTIVQNTTGDARNSSESWFNGAQGDYTILVLGSANLNSSSGYTFGTPPAGSMIREPAKLVMIVLPGARDDSSKLDAVRAAYKLRFHQQSVLLMTHGDCVSF